MSEEYKSAYKALRTKDLLLAIQPDIGTIAIVLLLFALLTIVARDMTSFIVVAAIAAIASFAYFTIRFLVARCSLRIERLGYSEVELEYDASMDEAAKKE